MKYVLKRVIIGVLIFLIISFLKNSIAFATTIKVSTVTCPSSNGIAFCNNNENIITLRDGRDFTINSNSILKNIYIDYTGQNFSSGRYYISFDNPPFYVNDNTFDNADFYFKNLRPISCTYNDGVNAERQDCLSFFYYYDYYAPMLVPQRVTLSNQDIEIRYRAQSSVYDELNIPNLNHNYSNQLIYFVIPSGTNVSDMIIKLGGIGTYSGDLNNMFSGFDTSFINNYYLDYKLISGKTFSTTNKITFRTQTNNSYNFFKLNGYSYSLPTYVSQLNVNDLSDLINTINGASELEKDFAIQDRLIGNDVDDINSKEAEMITGIATPLNDSLSNSPSIFYDFLALPIDLLRENSQFELYQEVGGANNCTHYASQYLNQTEYSSVYGEVNLTIPFTHNNFKLDCTNVNVLSPYNRYFGSWFNNDSNLGLDITLRPIWHIVLTGILSYRVIVAYFRLIKDIYDPDDMTIEVLDI